MDNIDHELQDAVFTVIGTSATTTVGGTVNATSTSTGSLIVPYGGVGVGLDMYVGGNGTFAGTTASTSKTTGTIVTAGGLGVSKDSFMSRIILDAGDMSNPGLQFFPGGLGSGLYGLSGVAIAVSVNGSQVAYFGPGIYNFVALSSLIGNSNYVQSLSNAKLYYCDSVNGFIQSAVTNASSGSSASSDVVCGNDKTSDTAGFIDMGINSSGYSGSIGGASDAYVYCTADTSSAGGNLWVGSTTTSLYLFANTVTPSVSNAISFTGTTFKIPVSTAATSTSTGALVVTGGLGVGGAAYFGGAISVANGTQAAPGITFANSTNSGIYSNGANEISISLNGSRQFDVGFNGGYIYSPYYPFSAGNVGNSNVASFTWSSDTSTGMYRPGSGQIGLTCAGSVAMTMSATAVTIQRATSITANTGSSSTSTGSLIVTGGVGISGNCYVGGIISSVSGTGVSISTTNTLLSSTLATNAIYRLSVTTGSATIYGSFIISTFDNLATLVAGSAVLVVTVSTNNTVNLKTTAGTYANTNWSLVRDV